MSTNIDIDIHATIRVETTREWRDGAPIHERVTILLRNRGAANKRGG